MSFYTALPPRADDDASRLHDAYAGWAGAHALNAGSGWDAAFLDVTGEAFVPELDLAGMLGGGFFIERPAEPRGAADKAFEGPESDATTQSVTGGISGILWVDANGDGRTGADEARLSGWRVYLDADADGQYDQGEVTTTTDASGAYLFSGVDVGAMGVGVVPQDGLTLTVQAAGALGALKVPDLSITDDGSVVSTAAGPQAGDIGGVRSARVEDAGPAGLSESLDVINMTAFQNDPRFAGIDGSGETIVVLDTGIDADHPAFGPDADGDGMADAIMFALDFTGSPSGANDVAGHGTHVSHTALGVATGARIIHLKVLGDDGFGSGVAIQEATQWVIANAERYGISAMNMSLGTRTNDTRPDYSGYLADELLALAEMGVVTVAAAGNSYHVHQAEGVGYPAADPNSLAVGSVFDSDVGREGGAYSSGVDRIYPTSQRDTDQTEIFAPGSLINAAWPGGDYRAISGTSMASPHIAGVAGLMQQLAQRELGRNLDIDEFRWLIQSSAVEIVDGDDEDDPVQNTGGTYHRVDVHAMGEALLAYAQALATKVVRVEEGRTAGVDFGFAPATDDGPGAPDGPVARDDRFEIAEDSPAFTASLFADNGAGADAAPGGGTISVVRVDGRPFTSGEAFTTTSGGRVIVSADGEFTYDANGAWDGLGQGETGTDGFGYTITDATGATAQAQVTILVAGRSDGGGGDDDFGADVGSAGRVAVGASVSGSIEAAGDRDWFAVSLEAGTRYTISLTGQTGGGGTLADPIMRLYDDQGVLLGQSDDANGTPDSELVIDAGADQTFYVSAGAYADGATGTYTVSVEAGAGGGVGPSAQDDRFDVSEDVEQFVGSLFADNGFGADTSPSGRLAVSSVAGRVDWVGLDLSIGEDNGALRVEQDGAIVFSPGDGLEGLAEGELFEFGFDYEVVDATGATSTASVTFVVEGSSNVDYAADTTTRGRIAAGQSVVSALEAPGDADWFAVELTAGQDYVFALTGAPSGDGTLGDPYLAIYNAAGQFLAADDDSGNGYESQLAGQVSTSGTYYLEANSYAGLGAGTYTLSVYGDGPGGGGGGAPVAYDDAFTLPGYSQTLAFDVFADNGAGADTDPDGDPLAITSVANVAVGDGQTVRLSSGATVTVSRDGRMGYDRGDAFADLGFGETATESFSYTVSDPSGLQASATVSVTVSGAQGDDHGQSPDDATLVTLGSVASVIEGSIEAGGDQDWFAVDLDAGARYVVELRGAPSGVGTLADPFLRLMTADGRVVGADDDSGRGLESALEFTVQEAGTFYLSAGAYHAVQTGSYQLLIDDVTNVVGSASADTLFGSSVTERIEGGDGDDVLVGLDGSDEIYGGAGDDVLYGDEAPADYGI